MENKDHLIKDSFILFVATSVVNVTNFLFHMYVTRKLGPEGYGVLATMLGLLIIVTMPAVSLQLAITRRTASFKARGKLGSIEHLFKKTTKWFLALGAAYFAVFYFGQALLGDFFHIKDRKLIIILGFIAIMSLMMPIIRGILQGLQKFVAFGANSVTDAVLRLVFLVLFIWFGWGVEGALGASFASALVAYIAGIFMIGFVFRAKEEDAEVITKKELFSYAIPVFFSMLGFSLLSYLDLFLVKHFFSEEQAGFYAVTSIIGKAFLFFPSAIVMALFPKVAESHELKKETAGYLYRSLWLTAGISAAGIAFCGLFPEFVIDLLTGGREYHAITPVVRIFGIAILPLVLFNVLINYCLASHKYSFIYVMYAGTLLYAGLLWFFHGSFYQVVATMFGVGTAVFVLSMALTLWREKKAGA